MKNFMFFALVVVSAVISAQNVFAQNKLGIGNNTPTEKVDVIGNIKADTLKANALQVTPNAATGKVLLSDALGNASWQTLSGSSSGSLDAAYDYTLPGTGRTIIADSGAVKIVGEDGLLVTGSLGVGENPEMNGLGTRLFFNPRRAAFRTGHVTSNNWNTDSIGNYSIALGFNTKAKGHSSFAVGFGAEATGISSTAMGFGNKAIAPYATAMGYNTTASGNYALATGIATTASGSYAQSNGYSTIANGTASVANGYLSKSLGDFGTSFGYGTNASGASSTVVGDGTQANAYSSLVVGQFNDTIVAPEVISSSISPLLIVGNGISPSARSNALVVRNDGKVGIGTNIPTEKLHIIGNIKADTAHVNVIIADNGPVKIPDKDGLLIRGTLGIGDIVETAGSGTRMFFNPRKAAFRAGEAYNNYWNDTNVAYYSLALGYRTVSQGVPYQPLEGVGSFVTGYQNSTYGSSYAAVFGRENRSDNANNASVFGYRSEVSYGENVLSAGYFSLTNGNNSVGFSVNDALGNNNFAIGGYTKSDATFVKGNARIEYNSDYSLAINSGVATGIASAMIGGYYYGSGDTASGDASFVFGDGSFNKAREYASSTFGKRNQANSYSCFAIGALCNPVITSIPFTPSIYGQYPLFIVGNGRESIYGASFDTLSNALLVNNTGSLFIGNIYNTSGNLLTLNNDSARKPISAFWTITSDERLKNIEGNYMKGLKEILQLQPIAYHYKNAGERKFTNEVLQTEAVGFSAQHVQKLFPESVGVDDDGYLNLDTHAILIAYTNAIKELNAKNELQQERNSKQKKQISEQEQQINQILEELNNLKNRK